MVQNLRISDLKPNIKIIITKILIKTHGAFVISA